MSRRTLEILDDWDLLAPEVNLGRYSIRDWKDIGFRLEKAYRSAPQKSLGTTHLGATQGQAMVEGTLPVSELALPLLTSEKTWLPDPLYGFLSRQAAQAWQLLPDAKSDFFGPPGVQTQWSPLHLVPRHERKAAILATVPPYLERLRELRPLLEMGALELFPGEPVLLREKDRMREVVLGLGKSDIAAQLTQHYKQIQYNLGVRVGAFGLEAKEDFADGITKKGDPLHFVDKEPMILLGALNATLSRELAASFLAKLPGDRMVYDHLRGAPGSPEPSVVAECLQLPELAAATWSDMVAIRRNDECLGTIRKILANATGLRDEAAVEAVRHELEVAAARLAEDAGIWKHVGLQTKDVAIAALLPASLALTGPEPELAVVTTLGLGAIQFLISLRRAYGSSERRQALGASELLVSVASKL